MISASCGPPPLPLGLLHKSGSSTSGKELLVCHLRTISDLKNGYGETSELSVRRLISNRVELNRLLEHSSDDAEHSTALLISIFSPVCSIIQNGPSCGLVALAMAGQLMNGSPLDVDKLMTLARECGYTRHGEMFSAENLLSLAQKVLPTSNGCVLSPSVSRETKIRLIVERLARQDAVVIPYDRDANSEPTQKQGHFAHWAVLNGLLLTIDAERLRDQHRSLCKPDAVCPRLLHAVPGNNWSAELLDNLNAGEVFVYAMHGRGTQSNLWSLTSLLDSNDQLKEINIDKKESFSSDFCIPEGGVEKGLCGRVILLSRPG